MTYIHATGSEWEFALRGTPTRNSFQQALNEACGNGFVKVVGDPSVPVDSPNDTPVELVFTPTADCQLAWDKYSAASAVCDDFNAYDPNNRRHGRTRSAGHHVHVSRSALAEGVTAEEFTIASIAHMNNSRGYLRGAEWFADPMAALSVNDIVCRYGKNYINPMLPKSRRDAYYCAVVSNRTIALLEADKTMGVDEIRASIGQGKYHAINLGTWDRNKTIEFRQGACTWNMEKSREWTRLLLNLVYSTREDRVIEGVEITVTTPTSGSDIFRANSRAAPQYDLMRTTGGATTREIISVMGGNEGDVRRRVSELRTRFTSMDLPEAAVVTHTQQAQGQSYGSGTDHTRYEVLTTYTSGQSDRMVAENRRGPSTIFAKMSDEEYEYWQDRIAALA